VELSRESQGAAGLDRLEVSEGPRDADGGVVALLTELGLEHVRNLEAEHRVSGVLGPSTGELDP
jgi:hypothetical protein